MPGIALGLGLGRTPTENGGGSVAPGSMDFSHAEQSGLLILLEDI
jgi:hypothetical protein